MIKEFPGVGRVVVSPSTAFAQTAMQWLGWPFYFFGGIGAWMGAWNTFEAGNLEPPDLSALWPPALGCLAGCLVMGVGFLCKVAAETIRNKYFHAGDWYSRLLSCQSDQPEAANEAAIRLIHLPPEGQGMNSTYSVPVQKMRLAAYAYREEYTDALSIVDELLETDPEDGFLLNRRITFLIATRRNEEALQALEVLPELAMSPQDKAVMRAGILLDVKQFSAAREEVSKIEAIADELPNASSTKRELVSNAAQVRELIDEAERDSASPAK